MPAVSQTPTNVEKIIQYLTKNKEEINCVKRGKLIFSIAGKKVKPVREIHDDSLDD